MGNQMLVLPPTGLFLILFTITSILCVNYTNPFETESMSRNIVVVIVLVVAQLLISIPFEIIYYRILMILTPNWPWGESGLFADQIIGPASSFAHIWALLVVNFAYLIWTKPLTVK
jgi:hypothetical protein